MSLFNVSDVQKYRYKVAQCTLMMGDETIEVRPEAVGGMMIEESFSSASYPIFRLNIATDSDTYYKISKNKTTLKVHLNIQSYHVTTDVNGNLVNESAKKVWINDNFCTISSNIAVDKGKDISMKEDRTKANPGDSEDRHYVSELYLWRVETANGFKKVLNAVLHKTTMSSIIAWALSSAGISNCIMSPLENNDRYDEILIPPLPIDRLIQHLDAMYGFYKYGSLIYFGIKNSYILNFNGKCTAWGRGEVQNVTLLIPKTTANESSEDGGAVDKGDSSHYIYMRYLDTDFSSPSTVDNVTNGTDAVVVTKTTSDVTRSKGKSVSTNDKNNTNVISNSTENKWIAETYTAQASSKKNVITGMIKNADLDDLTPNKIFTVAVEDPSETKNSKGNYKLFTAIHRFSNDRATGDFAVESSVELRRMEST